MSEWGMIYKADVQKDKIFVKIVYFALTFLGSSSMFKRSHFFTLLMEVKAILHSKLYSEGRLNTVKFDRDQVS